MARMADRAGTNLQGSCRSGQALLAKTVANCSSPMSIPAALIPLL